jgi:hypothetical protein
MKKKTLRSRPRSSTISFSGENIPEDCCDMTLMGIHKWYVEMFEKLGWMVLAKSKGMNDKVQTYVNSIERLKHTIEMKHKKIRDADKKDDLRIMLENLHVLRQHCRDDFA